MNRTVILVVVILPIVALTQPAYAQSGIEKRAVVSGDEGPALELRTEPWVATREVTRAPPGGAVLRSRVVWPSDFGTWAYVPTEFGPTPVAVTGGEVGLTSRLSMIVEGAQDTVDRRFSGMVSGLRLHLLPKEAPLQLSLAGGVARDLAGASGQWSQINVAHDTGRWRFVGSLRASVSSGNAWSHAALSGSAGVSVDLKPVRVGLEYAFDQGMGSRSALLGWVALPLENGPFMLRATASAPLGHETLGRETGYSIGLAVAVNF